MRQQRPSRARQKPSHPARPTTSKNPCKGSLAQLVEQLTFNQLVAGSNPARPTNVKKRPKGAFLLSAGFKDSNLRQVRVERSETTEPLAATARRASEASHPARPTNVKMALAALFCYLRFENSVRSSCRMAATPYPAYNTSPHLVFVGLLSAAPAGNNPHHPLPTTHKFTATISLRSGILFSI